MAASPNSLIITFAGDSGDGVQLLGNLFADNVAQLYYDINTLPEFPAEIRAPINTLDGVSSFKIKWGSERIYTSGDKTDILVVFNAVSLFKYSHLLTSKSVVIYDKQGFEDKNFKGFSREEFEALSNTKIGVDFTKNTLSALKDIELEVKAKYLHKNIYALGYILFGIGTDITHTQSIIQKRFSKKPQILQCQEICLKAGHNFGEISEFTLPTFTSSKSALDKGKYLNLTGNQAVAKAILHSSFVFDKKVLFGGYPITPASDILHILSKDKFEEITVVQAEDEMAAIGYALGASFGGNIGVCASSGPGISLKQEMISLSHMTDIPVLVIDVQRAGPSTGMPTKVEQADLNLALYGRHGDCPVPVVAISSPALAYQQTLNAIEIMLKFKTPVILLSDAQIAIGSELMSVPSIEKIALPINEEKAPYVVGGLEKDSETKKVSYDGNNHQLMMNTRQNKVVDIGKQVPKCKIAGNGNNANLVISWGSGYNVVNEFIDKYSKYDHLNLSWIFPLPENFTSLVSSYKNIYVVEMNSGQLFNYLKTETDFKYHSITKQQGVPFYSEEIKTLIESV